MPLETTTQTQLTFANTVLGISDKFLDTLRAAVSNEDISQAKTVTINFRDSSYSTEAGGFHPIEVCFTKLNGSHCHLLYITDFSFSGGHYPELARDLDFDIGNNALFTRYSGWQCLDRNDVREMYKLWEGNFLAYLDMDSFDEIKVECF
ncbi:DUF2787 domain-containing protein [Vibrio parahaemolyticus]|uniref:DUF2787 domain-containing protein n=1 Tax=Vibrio parahaemolyticus TaxID=670 RepID=UPI0011242180|nr:DUF2787 domain-containing protein [Vibrio parahaemolyticus]EJV0609159.1 DUF2787 domain-containing protein [Vibrio parahaemolyticus]EJX5615266.1 DUF2787 domain-containing protein [Vibrio parahaemolyticus]ELB2065593.1 DUF2787 domain-containing protein [Vibrio parahaemolyticus]ELB2114373.1 DUF2787 domain-containing protein [Vibrio parahaemolyticus]MBM5171029.1 DUF2787 domain-containing protein [Vibrio parahaemolyticus]